MAQARAGDRGRSLRFGLRLFRCTHLDLALSGCSGHPLLPSTLDELTVSCVLQMGGNGSSLAEDVVPHSSKMKDAASVPWSWSVGPPLQMFAFPKPGFVVPGPEPKHHIPTGWPPLFFCFFSLLMLRWKQMRPDTSTNLKQPVGY